MQYGIGIFLSQNNALDTEKGAGRGSSSPRPAPFSGPKENSFLRKIGVDGREEVDKKATKNDIRKRACSQPSLKFIYELFSMTQSVLLGFS